MSVRIFELPPKAGLVTNSTKMAIEDVNDETNQTRMVSLSDVTPYTWGSSDEDSPLSVGILYTTETAAVARTLKKAIISLKNAPTGNTISVDILKETNVNTNVFVTIFSVLPTIMMNEFTSETSLPVSMISDTTWQLGRRLQIKLVTNDANFAATGLKVTVKS